MLVQAGLCRTCSETTLLVFPRGGSYITEPGKHIALLYAKWESAIGEKDRLVKQMGEMETRFKEDLHQQLEAQKTDAEGNISDAVEKAKLEGIK